MAINFEPTIQTHTVASIFTKHIAKVIPLAFDDSMSYYECICAFRDYLNTVIIPNVNNVNDAVAELQTLYLDLQDAVNQEIERFETDITTDFNNLHDFVDNYFENNFPALVSSTLDEMAEDGTLENLLNDAAHLTKSYDTYTDMIADSATFTNGLRLKTSGYYTINDGGGAEYYVNNSVIATNYQIDLQNGLYLNLVINDNVNVKQLGAKGDNLNDDTNAIKSAIALNQPLYFPEGTYLISETITLTNNVNWEGQGRKTIFNSIPISETNQNLIQPLFDFSNLTSVRLKGFSTNNSTFKVIPTIQSGENIKEVLKNRNIIIEDVTIDTNNLAISEKTNWEGMFINTPAPDNYTRDFHDGKYSRYGIQIFNNSGYNAIDIDNRIYDGEGNFATIQDNSALGIVDGVLSSAPAFFMDMHGERNAINIKNRTETSSASSTSNPDSVFQVGYQGHLAIGCSVYDETGAAGVGTVKLKDSSPSIRFYDTNYPNNICMIREQNNQLQFLANGTLCSHYNNNFYHEYKKPLKIDDIVTTGGGLILGSTAFSGSDYHIFVDANGILRINRTASGTPQTAEAGYSIQINKSGASSSRPTGLSNDWQSIGTMYFDTTLGKPIFWNGTGWVDANGTSV